MDIKISEIINSKKYVLLLRQTSIEKLQNNLFSNNSIKFSNKIQ